MSMRKFLNKKTLSSNGGFTLVELIVSSAIILISVMGAYSMYVSQVQLQVKTSNQLQTRTFMDQVISMVSANPQNFPPVQKATSTNTHMFIACMNLDGIIVANSAGLAGFYLPSAPTYTNCTAGSTDPFYCRQKCLAPGVEVHLKYSGQYIMDINLLLLSNDLAAGAGAVKIDSVISNTVLVNGQLAIPIGEKMPVPP